MVPYIKALTERGHEVRLFDLAGVRACPTAIPCKVVDIATGVDPRREVTKWRYGRAAWTLRSALSQYRPDIVHAHYASSSGVVCALAGLQSYIVSLHGSDILVRGTSAVGRVVLRRVLGQSSLIHAVSDELAARARDLMSGGVADIRVQTQGIDLTRFPFDPPVEQGPPIRLLCTRTLEAIYSNDTLIRACARLRQRGVPVELTLAAGGPDQAALERLVDAEGLSRTVQFLGGFHNEQLTELMRQHDVYVSASLSDGTSISLLEAMAFGLFPVISRIESNLAWVTEGETASLFAPGNADELADVVEKVAREGISPEAVRRNRVTIEVRADREKNMDEMEKWYVEVVARHKSPVR